MVVDKNRSVSATDNSYEGHSINHVGTESIKDANDQQKKEIDRLT